MTGFRIEPLNPAHDRKSFASESEPLDRYLREFATHRIFSVTGSGRQSKWTEIGAAWPNRDDAGFSIDCSAFPLGGRIVMRRIVEKASDEAEAA